MRVEALRERAAAADARHGAQRSSSATRPALNVSALLLLRSVPLDAYAAFVFLCGCARVSRELSLLKTSMRLYCGRARACAAPRLMVLGLYLLYLLYWCSSSMVLELFLLYLLYFLDFLMFEG